MFVIMAVITLISFTIATYIHCSEDLYQNLPDSADKYRDCCEVDDSALALKHSMDEACGHYRGSSVISSDGGYSADLQVKKYRFESNEEGDLRHRLLPSSSDAEESIF